MRTFYFINAWMALVLVRPKSALYPLIAHEYLQDVCTFLLPLPSIMRLKLSLGQRISVTLIFAVGVMSVDDVAMCLVYLSSCSPHTALALPRSFALHITTIQGVELT
jgi:hypothetical protein